MASNNAPRPRLVQNRSRTSSIRLRRSPSMQNLSAIQPSRQYSQETVPTISTAPQVDDHGDVILTTSSAGRTTGRSRAISDPHDLRVPRKPLPGPRAADGGTSTLPDLAEESGRDSMAQRPADFNVRIEADHEHDRERRLRDQGNGGSRKTRSRAANAATAPVSRAASSRSEYNDNMVGLLDLVDPEVSTLATLTNVQNSLFVPNFGRFLNRRPTYNLTRADNAADDTELSDLSELETPSLDDDASRRLQRSQTAASITSRPTSDHYAVLPHGADLDGWSREDQRLLDNHVRHMLHSKRSKFKRSMKGFGQYVRKPLGFFVTLYATLITIFGFAWVLFLIGWVNLGGRKDYIVNVIDNVLVALFAIMGDGLIPWRLVDTYHMIWIAHYAHTTWRLRRERALPSLVNHNELPILHENDLEAADKLGLQVEELSVLSPLQQKRLVHHQTKFSNSHTFYKPHETPTHHAYPIRLLITVVVLLDAHSCLQIALGLCTWIIPYQTRPFALTTVILCCSITVNITAGVLISIGDHKTRKKDVLELMHKQELTAEAMRKLEKRKRKEEEREREMEADVKVGTARKSGVGERPRQSGLGERSSGVGERPNGVGNKRAKVATEDRMDSDTSARAPPPRIGLSEGTKSVIKNGVI